MDFSNVVGNVGRSRFPDVVAKDTLGPEPGHGIWVVGLDDLPPGHRCISALGSESN